MALRDFKSRDELAAQGIAAEWRVDELHELHDRFIISRDNCYNAPPVNTIFSNMLSELGSAVRRPSFEEGWARAKSNFG